jgi:hypothetical protein
MRGLDPRIHPLRKMMDCRVEPGNDSAQRGYDTAMRRQTQITSSVLSSVSP